MKLTKPVAVRTLSLSLLTLLGITFLAQNAYAQNVPIKNDQVKFTGTTLDDNAGGTSAEPVESPCSSGATSSSLSSASITSFAVPRTSFTPGLNFGQALDIHLAYTQEMNRLRSAIRAQQAYDYRMLNSDDNYANVLAERVRQQQRAMVWEKEQNMISSGFVKIVDRRTGQTKWVSAADVEMSRFWAAAMAEKIARANPAIRTTPATETTPEISGNSVKLWSSLKQKYIGVTLQKYQHLVATGQVGEGKVYSARKPGATGNTGKTSVHSPESLPCVGAPVELHMLVGGNSGGLKWGTHIGFGAKIPLNLLTKIHVTSDGRFARVYLPDGQGMVVFEQDDTDQFKYNLVENEICFSSNTSLRCYDNNADGILNSGDCVKLSFPGNDEYEYGFESFTPASGELAGRVFRISMITNAEGHATTFTYNSGNVTITDASNQPYACYYDSQKRITRITVNNAKHWDYSYQTNTVIETDAQSGLETTVVVTALDKISSVVTTNASASETISKYFYYDSAGNLTRRTVNGVNTDITVTQGSSGETYTETTNGITRSYVSGKFGVNQSTDSAGKSINISYNEFFSPTAITDENNNTVTYAYDADGHMTKEVDSEGGETSYAYDADKNLTRVVTPGSTADYEYDSAGRKTRAIYAVGVYESYFYNCDAPKSGRMQRRISSVMI